MIGTIALNIADCTRYDEIIRSMMLAPHMQQRQTIDPEPKNLDGDCIVLSCEQVQAEGIVTFLRDVVDKRQRQYPVRAYRRGSRGGWRRF